MAVWGPLNAPLHRASIRAAPSHSQEGTLTAAPALWAGWGQAPWRYLKVWGVLLVHSEPRRCPSSSSSEADLTTTMLVPNLAGISSRY